MNLIPLRLQPGDDLRGALELACAAHGLGAAFVLSGIGSLARSSLRHAGKPEPEVRIGAFEIVSVSGTLSSDGAHLHAALADAEGQVVGGHVSAGCIVRTTAEVLIVGLTDWRFGRAHDPATGYTELVIERQPRSDDSV